MKILKFANRTISEIFAVVVVRLFLVVGFFWLIDFLMPINLLGIESAVLVGLAVAIWWIEFENYLLSDLLLFRAFNKISKSDKRL